MKNKHYIDMSQFIIEAAQDGFELLALHSRVFKNSKIPRSLLSFCNNNLVSEADDWLYNLASWLILKDVELVKQECLKYAHDFFRFLETIPFVEQECLTNELFASLECYDIDFSEIQHISDVPEDLIDNILWNCPIKVTTISSKLFDKYPKFLNEIDNFLPELVANKFNLLCDAYSTSFINESASKAYHSIKEYKTSYTIISYSSTAYDWYCFSDYLPYSPTGDELSWTLKEFYKSLLD